MRSLLGTQAAYLLGKWYLMDDPPLCQWCSEPITVPATSRCKTFFSSNPNEHTHWYG